MKLEYSDTDKMRLRIILGIMRKVCADHKDDPSSFKASAVIPALENNQLTYNDLKYIRFALIVASGALQGEEEFCWCTEMLFKTAAMLKGLAT